MGKMWYEHTIEYYSTINTNEILLFGANWIEVEDIMLSEISRLQKDKYHMYEGLGKVQGLAGLG
jgi:hypothetical protein